MDLDFTTSSEVDDICQSLTSNGYWIGNLFDSLINKPPLRVWNAFSDTWDKLGRDNFMADGGDYRSRRFSELKSVRNSNMFVAAPHGPFFQSKELNKLNGGVQRHFDPVTPFIYDHPFTKSVIRTYHNIFDQIVESPTWKIYLHQVRVTATPGKVGKPTPEGPHQDGITFGTIFLVNRKNARGAENVIYDLKKNELERIELTKPGDCILFIDDKIFHYVEPLQTTGLEHATRDMLFVEFIK